MPSRGNRVRTAHQDLHGAPGRARLALAALIEALPAHAVEPAAALHAQAFFGPQVANGRQKDFFGRGMPWSSSTTCSIVRSNKFGSAPFFNCFSYKRCYSRSCVSNCLMRCSGLWSDNRRGNGGSAPTGLKGHEMRGIAPAPGQDSAAALDAVAPLGLLVAQLAAADLARHGQFNGQTVVALTTPRTRLGFVFHDSFQKSVNTYPDETYQSKKATRQGDLFTLIQL